MHFILYSLALKRRIPLTMPETIRSTLDNGKYGCGVFIDLKKVFDTVKNSILLKKGPLWN